MKFTIGWLKDYLDYDSTNESLCEKLTSIGLEVEYFSDPRLNLKISASKVLDVKKHPNADKLSICDVFDGKEKLKNNLLKNVKKKFINCTCTNWVCY